MAQVFTDAQINEILNIFKQHMGHRQYIGARYVPIFGRKGEESILWDNSAPYEPLTIVLYQGNSYTSRQYVPAGIEITNNNFWAETGNYNAQLEQYRQEVLEIKPLADAFGDSKPINVLTLGFDNTGTTDVSDLFNQYAADNALYFPAGIYKIDKQVNISHSIYGAGFTRNANNVNNANQTIFIANVDKNIYDSIFKIAGQVNYGIVLDNFSIDCGASVVDAIKFSGLANGTPNFIKNIKIWNLNKIGINADDVSVFASRPIWIDNISIHATPAINTTDNQTIGIRLGRNIGDCRISNIELMCCVVGIEYNSGPQLLSNAHIWCGSNEEKITPTQFGNTFGIQINGGTLMATNLYTDTCRFGVYIAADWTTANITNHLHLGDGTVSAYANFAIQPIHIGNNLTHSRVFVNGGRYQVYEDSDTTRPTGAATSLNTQDRFITIKDVFITNPSLGNLSLTRSNFDRLVYSRGFTVQEYTTTNKNPLAANGYMEIAKILRGGNYGGFCRIEVAMRNSSAGSIIFNIGFDSGGAAWTVTRVDNGTAVNPHQFYYRIENDAIRIYFKAPANTTYSYAVKQIFTNGNLSLIPYMETTIGDWFENLPSTAENMVLIESE